MWVEDLPAAPFFGGIPIIPRYYPEATCYPDAYIPSDLPLRSDTLSELELDHLRQIRELDERGRPAGDQLRAAGLSEAARTALATVQDAESDRATHLAELIHEHLLRWRPDLADLIDAAFESFP